MNKKDATLDHPMGTEGDTKQLLFHKNIIHQESEVSEYNLCVCLFLHFKIFGKQSIWCRAYSVVKSRNSLFGKKKEGGAGERIFRRNKGLIPLLNP